MGRQVGFTLLILAVIAGVFVFASSRIPQGTHRGELKIPLLSHSDPNPAAKDSMVLRGNFGSHYVTLEVRHGGDAKQTDTSNLSADPSETRPLSSVSAAAPESLAREGAQRLHVALGTLNYVNYDASGPPLPLWRAFFKDGAWAAGDKAGRVVKTGP